MAIDPNTTSIAILAPAVQGSASELWQHYVSQIMPGMAGQQTSFLVGVCAAIIVAHFATSSAAQKG